jgi:hypothetical protein
VEEAAGPREEEVAVHVVAAKKALLWAVVGDPMGSLSNHHVVAHNVDR